MLSISFRTVRKSILQEYKEYVDLANELVEKEFPNNSIVELDAKESSFQRHIINMIEMFAIRNGVNKNANL